ncbi:hypothetical protein SAMN04487955_10651 [Halomonas korlensis]|uniref:Uncharacterized protein n=1 Tax=Halomonas korlensis TaxID=463301 RepID=A0A1I7I5X6_9GAMM|nr:hypothetical protein SAMN04487955_10651 [Halomonas korlensis]
MRWRCGQAYGQDLRDRVMAAEGLLHEVATRYGVSVSYVARVRARQRRGVTAGAQCNHVPLRLQGQESALAGQVAAVPDRPWPSSASGSRGSMVVG